MKADFESGDIMSNIIEDFYYGNIEPQEVNSELTPKLKKKLKALQKSLKSITNGNGYSEWVIFSK